MTSYGEKIRARAYRGCPDDIWLARGYAWSIHVRGRFMRGIKMLHEAQGLFTSALEIRDKCAKRFPDDLGVSKDLVKNLAEIVGLGLLQESERENFLLAIRKKMKFIKNKERDSLRLGHLKREIT